MPFHTIHDYHHACLAQVALDNANGIECVYLPNTVFTTTPDFALICPEPSLAGMPIAGFQAMIDAGFTNFLYSRGDFILQYCAYKYLCSETFGFIATDLAKGAMTVYNAAVDAQDRYESWFPILCDELPFYGNPIRIAIGGRVGPFLGRHNLPAAQTVWHYSGQVNPLFMALYGENPDLWPLVENLDEELMHFVELVFATINYPQILGDETLLRLFQNPLPPSCKGMYLHYRERFLGLEGNQ